MVNFIEKLLQINIDYPFTSFSDVLLDFQYSLLGFPTLSKTITVFRKHGFKCKNKFLIERLLNNPIHDCWNSKLTNSTSVWFGNLNPFYRARAIFSIKDILFNLGPLFLHYSFDFFSSYSVNSGSPFIAYNCLHCFLHVIIIDYALYLWDMDIALIIR